MLQTILWIHFCVGTFFLIYILIDRLYIRIFIEENARGGFYSRVKYPMLFIAFILVLTGAYLLFSLPLGVVTIIKAVLALVLLLAFFYCPLYMKAECSTVKRILYRYFVLILTIVVFSLGIYL